MDTPSKSPSTPGRPVSDAQRVQALRVLNRRPWRLRWFSEWMFILFCAVVVVFFVARPFFVEAFKIPSGSMENTLLVGDFLFVNKAVYGAEVPFVHVRLPALQHPKRGEILVFEYPPNPEKDYVKRLVGLPGDTVEMRRSSYARPKRARIRRVTTGVRWSSQRGITSCSVTIATTRPTAATGASCRIRSCGAGRCSCITATSPTRRAGCRG
jgi:signal peptidase I